MYIDSNRLAIFLSKVGLIHATQTAVELMSIENGGRGGIVANVASVCGLDYIFGVPIYNATKHAVVGFTRSLAVSIFDGLAQNHINNFSN